MKRLVIVLTAAALLLAGSAVAAFAQTPNNGAQPGWGCGGWGAGTNGSYDYSANPTLKALASKLNIDVNALVSELESGKSLLDVATEKGVSREALVEVLQAPHNTVMDLRVEQGYLTQDQANAMKEFMAQRYEYMLEQDGFFGWGGMMGPGFGPRGGMMGPGFGGRGGMMGPGFSGSRFGPGFRS